MDYGKLAFEPARWSQLGFSTQMVPWDADRVVFLTTSADLDRKVMAIFLNRLNDGWSLYADLTGRSPRPFKLFNGKPVLAAIPDMRLTCGLGCGQIVATGIEYCGFYTTDYRLVMENPRAFPHYYFYEMGRNYYTFGERHSLFTTGFAVFMRCVCMDTVGCEDKDLPTRKTIESAEDLYSRSDLTFLDAFSTLTGKANNAPRLRDRSGQPISPTDIPVMYASVMLRLRKDCGGNAWVRAFFKELAGCPKVRRFPRKRPCGNR